MDFLAMYTYQEMLTGSISRTGFKVLFSEKVFKPVERFSLILFFCTHPLPPATDKLSFCCSFTQNSSIDDFLVQGPVLIWLGYHCKPTEKDEKGKLVTVSKVSTSLSRHTLLVSNSKYCRILNEKKISSN